MSSLTSLALVAALGFGVYSLVTSRSKKSLSDYDSVKPVREDFLIQNPSVIPAAAVGEIQPDSLKDLKSGQLRDQNGKIAGGQYY